MPGSDSRSGPAGWRCQTRRDTAQIEPGNADPAARGVRIEPEPEVVGVEGAGDVETVDDLVRPVPAAGRELLGGGDARRVAEALHLHVPVLGVRGARLAVPKQHPHLTRRRGRERAKERLVGVVTPGRHLAQHVLDLTGRGRARRAHLQPPLREGIMTSTNTSAEPRPSHEQLERRMRSAGEAVGSPGSLCLGRGRSVVVLARFPAPLTGRFYWPC